MTRTTLTRLAKALVVSSAATLAGCAGGDGDDIRGKSIRYQVEYFAGPQTGSSHRALFISYSTADGLQEQRDVALPWTKVPGKAASGFTASVKAQFYGYGTITCRILADNKLIQQKSSMEGPYPTVECKA